MRIDCYCTTLSPFVYLAGDEPVRIAEKHGAELVWKPADFARIFAASGGVPLLQRPWQRQEYRLQELPRIARRRGRPLNVHPAHWPTDQGPSMLALCAASQAGGGDLGAAVLALGRACWAEEKDVADPDVVASALEATGLDPALAREPGPDAQAIFDANTAEAIERGVFGAPFYIVGEERFWGQDRLEYLDDHLGRLAAGEA